MSFMVRLLSVLLVGSVLIVGLVAFAASVSGTGGVVGAGSATVTAPDIKVTDVKWILDSGNPVLLSKVRLTIAKDINPGLVNLDVYLVLRDSVNAILGVESAAFSPDGSPSMAEFNFFSQGIAVVDIDSISVVACEDTTVGDFLCQ